MSTLPWGTLNDWQLLDVEERTTRLQRRIDAAARRDAQRDLATPVVRVPRTTQQVAQADCATAA
jgi:hypothetical protein